MRTRFSCYFIGKGELLFDCVDILRAAEHDLLGIISQDARTRERAQALGVRTLRESGELLRPGGTEPMDFLFSVANGEILRPAVLALPRRQAINVHNGPLPQYAGVHATSWAILNGETSHGVTWHVMDEGIDTGDILEQVRFPIGPSDTAADLNRACRHWGAVSFGALVKALSARDKPARRAQDLSRRSYYASHHRHPSLGTIDWSEPAEQIHRIFRAHCLDGPNGLGSPRVLIGRDAFVLSDCRPCASSEPRDPGTLIEVGDVLRVAAGRDAVEFRQLRDEHGDLRPAARVATELGYEAGDRLPLLDSALRAALQELSIAQRRSESFWLAALAAARTARCVPREASREVEVEIAPPRALAEQLVRAFAAPIPDITLCALVLSLFRRDDGRVVLGLSTPVTRAAAARFRPFGAELLPLVIDLQNVRDFADALRLVRDNVLILESHAPCARDLPLRYAARKLSFSTPVGVHVSDHAILVRRRVSPDVDASGAASELEETTLAVLQQALSRVSAPSGAA